MNLGWRGGKRVRKSLYGATRRDVQEKLSKALRAAEIGLQIDQDGLTVERFLAGWLEWVRPPTVRHSTWKSYEQIVRLYLVPRLGRERVAQLTPQAVEKAMADMMVRLSPRTALHARAVLRRALNRAVRDGLASRNAAALATPPRVEYRQAQSLSPAEVSAFLKTIAGDRLEALYVLALSPGCGRASCSGFDGPTSTSTPPHCALVMRSNALTASTGWSNPRATGPDER